MRGFHWFAVAVGMLLSMGSSAGTLAVHQAVLTQDGETRLLSCRNTTGAFVLYEPVAGVDAYIVNSDVSAAALGDVLNQILPEGWTIRYSTPGVEYEPVSLRVETYWADALQILAHDYNLVVVLDGARRHLVIGRM